MPEQNYNVTFHAWQNNVTAAALCESVTIKSLSDVYEKVEPGKSEIYSSLVKSSRDLFASFRVVKLGIA